MQGTGRVPAGAYWTFAALFGMNLLNFVDRYILASVLQPIKDDLHLDDAQAGLVGSAFLLTYALISPFIGWLGDRMTRKYLLAASVGVWSLATFGAGLSRSFEELVLARAVLAIGEATYTALAPTLLADLFPRQQRGWVLTLFWLGVPLGAAIGFPLGGLIGSAFGWRMAFFVVGLPGRAVALAALALREPQRGASDGMELRDRTQPVSWRNYAALARNPSFVCNCLAMAMFTFAAGGLQHWAASFFQNVRQLSPEMVTGYLGPILAVSGIVGMSGGGWLAANFSRRRPGAYFWVSGLTLLASVPFILGALLATEAVAIFPFLFAGLTLAFMNIGPSNTIIANVTPPRIRVGAMAINLFVTRVLGDIPSQYLMGKVSVWTGSLFWGVALAVPAFVAGGVLFCLGTPYLSGDQEAVLRELDGVPPRNDPAAPELTEPPLA
jgi:predicted MFS family arabinose efflux permease